MSINGRAPSTSPAEPRERILVVEDEDVIRHVISSFLGGKNCDVETAGSAEEAVPLLSGPPFGAALVDIILPGMNGLGMLAKIKELSPHTEVIIMTSHTSVDTATEAIRKGAYDYLAKPFEELEEIWDTLKRALEKKNLSLRNRRLVRDLAAQNTMLEAAVQRRDALIEAGRAMGGIRTLAELLDFFVVQVVNQLKVERVSLMLINDATKELSIVSSRGIPEDILKSFHAKVGEGVAGQVALTGKPIVVKDQEGNPRAPERLSSSKSDSFVSAPLQLSIPIVSQDRVLGVINITDKISGQPFDETDVAYIQGLAGQAAVAIERARHVEALEKAIVDLESAQEQLIVSERLKALGEMAAGVAHDFNNTLNGILLRAQALRVRASEEVVDAQELRQDLQMIEKLSLQGAETVTRIQDFTRIRKDKPKEKVDLNRVVRNAVEMTKPYWKQASERTGSQIEVHVQGGEVGTILGTPSELVQVVSNLIFNATDAMPGGGRIVVRTSAEGDLVKLEVSDNGTGMNETVKARIFEPFFTTKEKGQGLGTSIVYGIVNRHDAELTVESEEGKGSTFTILFPVHGPAPSESLSGTFTIPARVAGAKAANVRRGTVLIVEDEEQNRDVYRAILESRGFEVYCAEGGQAGLELLRSQSIDVVITDLSMPGMSGWDVARGVKAGAPGTPVILLSGWAVQEDEDKAQDAGVDYILSKPCRLDELVGAVRVALEAREAA